MLLLRGSVIPLPAVLFRVNHATLPALCLVSLIFDFPLAVFCNCNLLRVMV